MLLKSFKFGFSILFLYFVRIVFLTSKQHFFLYLNYHTCIYTFYLECIKCICQYISYWPVEVLSCRSFLKDWPSIRKKPNPKKNCTITILICLSNCLFLLQKVEQPAVSSPIRLSVLYFAAPRYHRFKFGGGIVLTLLDSMFLIIFEILTTVQIYYPNDGLWIVYFVVRLYGTKRAETGSKNQAFRVDCTQLFNSYVTMYQWTAPYCSISTFLLKINLYMKRKQIQATFKLWVWTFGKTRAADPHHCNADTDPFFHFSAAPIHVSVRSSLALF